MVSSEVQRTLVKSPPELWAELGDPAALGRHFAFFGEVRIKNVVPEKSVEWVGDDATGMVTINASGWGTKVTLHAAREVAPSDSAGTGSAELAGDPDDSGPEVSDGAVAMADIAADIATPEQAVHEVEPEMPLIEPQPEPRRGLLSRLFRRRPRPALDEAPGSTLVDPAPSEVADLEPEASRPADGDASAQTSQDRPPQSSASEPAVGELVTDEPAVDLSRELHDLEEVAAEEVGAALTAILDRLGAAHHRPFSRS